MSPGRSEELREYGRRWRKSNRHKTIDYGRKYRAKSYGISLEDYYTKAKEQGGVCAICKRPETEIIHGTARGLSVDHDHVRGHFRGLLCSACNIGLGKFDDDPDRLARAIEYIRASIESAVLPTAR